VKIKALAVVKEHRREFMWRAFPEKQLPAGVSQSVAAATISLCRPLKELQYITEVVRHWQVGVKIKEMDAGYERTRLQEFCRQNPNGAKFVKQYVLEEIRAPGASARTAVKRLELNPQTKKKEPGQIVICQEVFDAIDKWHRGNNHLGQERTWNFCKKKYFNVTQNLVAVYCETCLVCMKKNPIACLHKGSRKPIRSQTFRERFQLDLIDFCKLGKRDPFDVLMRWILTLKDHATGFIYLSTLPVKKALFGAYKLQEMFGVIGYPKIFHTDNGKEPTAKVILKLLREFIQTFFQ
jgi:hypothetical protein